MGEKREGKKGGEEVKGGDKEEGRKGVRGVVRRRE